MAAANPGQFGNVLRTLYEHVFRIRFDLGLDGQCCGAPEDAAPIAQAVGDLSMQVLVCQRLENSIQITYQTTPDILSNDCISIAPKKHDRLLLEFVKGLTRPKDVRVHQL